MIDYVVMNSPEPRKPSLTIFLALIAAGVVILLLALSVGQLNLDEGYLIPLAEGPTENSTSLEPMPANEVWNIILRGLMGLAMVALPIYVIQSFFSKKGRQQLLATLIIIGLLFLLMKCAENRDDQEITLQEQDTTMEVNDPFDIEGSTVQGEPLPVLPDEAPPWVNTVITILLILLVVGIVVAVTIFIQRRRKNNEPDALDRVADQAEDALRKIREGGDFNSAILNCYFEMNRIVKEELKIARQRTMTARDFESYLVAKGLPEAPLTQLTTLFERARYSNQSPDKNQEQTAIEALTALIETVHELAPKEEEEA